MKNYKIGEIFKDDKEYSDRAKFCNNNGLMIVEVAPDSKGERQFQIQEVPVPTEMELAGIRFAELSDELREAKYDVEQVELFGMERSDYEQKKARCKEIVEELRILKAQVNNG